MESRYKIITFGCQMNLADSGLLSAVMEARGYQPVNNEADADIIVLNTCSVRARAEDRIFGRLSELSRHKRADHTKKIAVVGCMAQRLKGAILRRAPHVDIILGPDRILDLPRYLDNGRALSGPVIHTEFGYENIEDIIPSRDNKYCSFVTISRGCDNFCTYCVVPYVRGRERSYPVSIIIKQINKLVSDGVREVTLLGQNVNSYRDDSRDFSDLLRTVSRETEIARIRFMTSHPKDMSDRLINVISDEPKMMAHVHLPMQSGSSRILEMMGRAYTFEHYLSLVEKLRRAVPHISLTTDLIVGFPSETEREYQLTLDAVRLIEFDSAFMFRYSSREGTAAAKYDDDVPEPEKIRRLTELINLQKQVALDKNQSEIGKIRSVLVDGRSRRSEQVLKGKTEGNKTILFEASRDIIGQIRNIRVTSADSWTLHGELAD